MDFQGSVGKKGRCKVGIRKWTGNNGQTMESNQITRFYEPEEASKPSYTPGSW